MSISNDIRCLLERAIARALIRECLAAGFVCDQVDDGDDLVKVRSENEAIDAAFAVDESRLRFRAADDTGKNAKRYNVLLIGGNGEDIISDWHCSNASFDAAVGRVAYNVEDLVRVQLAAYEPCTVAGPEGRKCRRPGGHRAPFGAYGADANQHESEDYKRW
jgi:hypothetical protein